MLPPKRTQATIEAQRAAARVQRRQARRAETGTLRSYDSDKREIARACGVDYKPSGVIPGYLGGGLEYDYAERPQHKPEEIGGAYGRHPLELTRDPETHLFDIKR